MDNALSWALVWKGDVKIVGMAGMSEVWGAVEAGGTKFVCALGTGPDHLIAEERVPTTTPEETLPRVVQFFRRHTGGPGPTLRSIGVGCFGPVDLSPESSTFGTITDTPKEGWSRVDVVGRLERELDVPVLFETDVNAAALGEHRWGRAKGLRSFVYLTVGTGIGGGALVHGRPVHGLVHPEMGHLRVPRIEDDRDFPGTCPYHGDCLEGLASGPALAARWEQPAETLPPDHPAWEMEAAYLASALCNLVFTLSPERIILGGGVMQAPRLIDSIRFHLSASLGGYGASPVLRGSLEQYVVTPGLGQRAGVLGALSMATG